MDPKVIEWEEEKEEEAAGGKLKSGCEKLKKNSNYHDRMMPVENVLRIMRDLNGVLDVDGIVEQYPSALTKDDAVILKDRRSLYNFKRVTDAV
ncbi:hypothetical protein OS493_031547, partial [Desmophyllum pertusum]